MMRIQPTPALSGSPVPSLGRAGAWPTAAVKIATTVALLRLRFKLTVPGKHERLLSGWYAVVFGSVQAPNPALAAKVHVTLALTGGKVVATAQTDAGVPASTSPGLQVGALCAQ